MRAYVLLILLLWFFGAAHMLGTGIGHALARRIGR